MTKTAGTTTLEVPLPLRARLARLRTHPRQPYHEVIQRALDALEMRTGERGTDPLVASHRQALLKAARRSRIARLWVFGPRARGEALPGSGVGLLVQALPGANLFHLTAFLADAEEILGVGVEVADLDGLQPAARDRILPEAVPV